MGDEAIVEREQTLTIRTHSSEAWNPETGAWETGVIRVVAGPDHVTIEAPRKGTYPPVCVDYWEAQRQRWVHLDLAGRAPTPGASAPPTAPPHPEEDWLMEPLTWVVFLKALMTLRQMEGYPWNTVLGLEQAWLLGLDMQRSDQPIAPGLRHRLEQGQEAAQPAASAASAPSPTQVTVGPGWLEISAQGEGPVAPVAVDYWDLERQGWVHFDFPAPGSPASDEPTARRHPPAPGTHLDTPKRAEPSA